MECVNAERSVMSGIGPQRAVSAVTAMECMMWTMEDCLHGPQYIASAVTTMKRVVPDRDRMFGTGSQWIVWTVTAMECLIWSMVKCLKLDHHHVSLRVGVDVVHVFSRRALSRFTEGLHVFFDESSKSLR